MQESESSVFPETADIETSSDGYASRFAGPVGAWMLARQERIVRDFLHAAQTRTILDVGGGHGQLARPLASTGYDVTVLGSAESCRARIADLADAGHCRFVVGNVVALPFPDRAFDAVVSVRLLPHCGRWPELIRELCRVARNVVVVDYPVASGLNAMAPWLFAAKQRMEKNTRTWRNFSHDEVAHAFGEAHYAPIARRGQFLWPMVVHRTAKCPALSATLEWLPDSLGLTRRFGTPVLAAFRRET
ncbi:MAG TPA: class I SAM-dependent methyltransferase [Kiritimatiellia bacterium]|nr:class I SAM-dependent methyltransferase [Kiritimatiellia bacterium]